MTDPHGRLEVTAATNLGRSRPSNEDAIVVGNWFGFGDVASHSTAQDAFADFLVAVADGLGGHRGGAVASRMVVEGLTARASALEIGRSNSVAAAIMAIDDDIRLRATADPSLSGMGSTLAMAVISANALKVVNVGDSRIYLSHNFDELTQISIDDVPVAPKSRPASAARSYIAGLIALHKRSAASDFAVRPFGPTSTISLFRCRGPFFSVRTD